MIIERYNKLGLKYILSDIASSKSVQVLLVHPRKVITLSGTTVQELSQRWYDWQQLGHSIQVAFSNLSDSEREFLMTGITGDEWNEMFKDYEEDNEK